MSKKQPVEAPKPKEPCGPTKEQLEYNARYDALKKIRNKNK